MKSSFFYLLTGVFLCFSASFAGAQQTRNANSGVVIDWQPVQTVKISPGVQKQLLYFTGAGYDAARNDIPFYSEQRNLPAGHAIAAARLVNPVYTPLDDAAAALLGKETARISDQPEVRTTVAYDRKQPVAAIVIYPFRKNPATGKIEKLSRFSIELESNRDAARAAVTHRSSAAVSVLASGATWERIGVAKTGVVKLDYNFFKNTIGVDPAGIDPRNIRLYGNGNGQISFKNSVAHYDDLNEYAITVQGESDGVFDAGDYVLFYGVSPNRWDYDSTAQRFHHKQHNYSDTTYYFLNWDLGSGKRIGAQGSSSASPTHTVNSFDDYQYHEEDLENMVKSGREWYGEKFEILTSYSFAFNFPNIVNGSSVRAETNLISRHSDSSYYQVTAGPVTGTLKTDMVDVANYTANYAAAGNLLQTFSAVSPNITVSILKQTPDAVGWLNWVEVNARRQLVMNSGQQLIFRDVNSTGAGNVAQYDLSNVPSGYAVWDVSDLANVQLQQGTLNGSNFTFTLPADTLKTFAAFDGSSFYSATYAGHVANQNLHGTQQADYVIVAHPSFLSDANDLALLHQVNDGLTTIVVTPQQIYNEFSSGAQDATAIRDFVKMLYDRAAPGQEPKYLLLYGDASYDNKRRLAGNTNFIPSFESINSVSPTTSYISDDYYGLLDNNEGEWDNTNLGLVDIGIGRFPVQNSDQSKAMVDKIKKYISKKPPSTTVSSTCTTDDCSVAGDWRTWYAFLGDDEDGNQYMDQANQLASYVDTAYDQYNLDKIFLDAYLEEHTSGGDRYPDVNSAIDQRVQKGCLIFNYTGHGGEVGLAHERVLEVGQINAWTNLCNMPLFITATCEFSRYDDPGRTSAGEYVLLNPAGGGIALFTTTRLTFAPNNYSLNLNINKNIFKKTNGEMPRLGDVYKAVKRAVYADVNTRTFTMLGDPALRLAYPENKVVTTHVNNVPVNMSVSDTARALSLITVKGYVSDTSGNKINNYNGVLYPTVFDKYTNVSTLNNDGSGVFNFKLQKNILFKGKVSVVNGDFTFTFVVPKDIAYQYGPGRISYYADNGDQDAAGWYENIVIGGSNPNAVADNNGPKLRLFLNDSNFVSGGMTDDAPKIYALVSDSNGVNTVGNGIGHDLVAVLDDQTDAAIILNDYYVANLNSYQKGTIIYPFSGLSEGAHKLSLKVWDVYNNSTTSYTDFVVSKSAELALDHVLNYPNPFTTRTQFFFGHNKCCTDFNVQVQVFTVSGKLVKTIDQQVSADGFRSTPIEWDGKDDYGDKIGKGVYVYRIKVRSTDGQTAEKYEKLVILN